MHFLLISQNLFFHEIKRDGRTSFMDFMHCFATSYEELIAVSLNTLEESLALEDLLLTYLIKFEPMTSSDSIYT